MKRRPTTREEWTEAYARVEEAGSAFNLAMVAAFENPGKFVLYTSARTTRDQYVAANRELIKALEKAWTLFELDAARAAGPEGI